MDGGDAGILPAVLFLANHLHHRLVPREGGIEELLGRLRHGSGHGPQGLGKVGQGKYGGTGCHHHARPEDSDGLWIAPSP